MKLKPAQKVEIVVFCSVLLITGFAFLGGVLYRGGASAFLLTPTESPSIAPSLASSTQKIPQYVFSDLSPLKP